MHIVYYCKYCKTYLGSLNSSQISYEALGFTNLTVQEIADMIEYHTEDQTTYVKTVCEYCETALQQNPALYLTNTPIQ